MWMLLAPGLPLLQSSQNSLVTWLDSQKSGTLQHASSAPPIVLPHLCRLHLLPSSRRTGAACRNLPKSHCTVSLGKWPPLELLCLSTRHASSQFQNTNLLGPGSVALAFAVLLDCWTSILWASLPLLLGDLVAHSSIDRRYYCPHRPGLVWMQRSVPARSWPTLGARGINICLPPTDLGTAGRQTPDAPWPWVAFGSRRNALSRCHALNAVHIGLPIRNSGLSSAMRFLAAALRAGKSKSHGTPASSLVVKSRASPGTIPYPGSLLAHKITRGEL